MQSQNPSEHRARLDELRARFGEVVGDCAGIAEPSPVVDGMLREADDMVSALGGWIGQGCEPAAAAGILAIELGRFKDDLRELMRRQPFDAVAKIQQGLAQLHTIRSIGEAVRRGPEIACRSCGFRAAVIVEVFDGLIVPASAWSERDSNWFDKVEKRLVGPDGHPMRITDMTVEREMVRRRRPTLVNDAMNDVNPGQELRKMTGVQSYVAAPIMPEDQVLAIIYAIQFDAPLNLVDRDTLWAFAEGYGYALERSILIQRSDEQAGRLRRLVYETEKQIAEIRDSQLRVIGSPLNITATRQHSTTAMPSNRRHDHKTLTRRELEVLDLLAGGATNRVVADRLMISPTTAKSHVENILRKLDVRNRAEAVKKYLELAYRSGIDAPSRDVASAQEGWGR